MLQTGGASTSTRSGSIQHHEPEGPRRGQLLGGPGRLSRLIGSHEERAIFVRQAHPVQRLEAARAIDDGDPPPLK